MPGPRVEYNKTTVVNCTCAVWPAVDISDISYISVKAIGQ